MSNQTASPSPEKPKATAARPERISQLSNELASSMLHSLEEINNINTKTKLLSFNAQIQAAKAGAAGASFAVVASEMNNLSTLTGDVSKKLAEETQGTIEELKMISKLLASNVRGKRLADMALTNIDLVDRNLYERTCDVRWWATDPSIVDAASNPTEDNLKYASKRLGVILDAYTVYFDLVLCDMDGNVIANGRPNKYKSRGLKVKERDWFIQAKNSNSGDDYGFETVHRSNLVDDKLSLVYSCGVRQEGESRGVLKGVLGIVFNWELLGQEIMKTCPLMPEEREFSRVVLVDKQGRVLADCQDKVLEDTIVFKEMDNLLKQDTGFIEADYLGETCLIAHAKAPGFETYSTGWYSLIIQQIGKM